MRMFPIPRVCSSLHGGEVEVEVGIAIVSGIGWAVHLVKVHRLVKVVEEVVHA